jgi:hypothetical protein
VTHALLNTTLTAEDGTSLGTGLDVIQLVEAVHGQIPGLGGDRKWMETHPERKATNPEVVASLVRKLSCPLRVFTSGSDRVSGARPVQQVALLPSPAGSPGGFGCSWWDP